MSQVIERLRSKFEESVVGGGVGSLAIIIHRLAKTNVGAYYRFASKLELMDDAILPSIYGVVGGFASDRFELPGWDYSLSVGVAEFVKGLYARFVEKQPFIEVPDASHVNAYNLTPNSSVTLIIDGTAQNITASTDANGKVSITLATPLASGKHEIIVTAGKKSAYAVVVV
jgi:hypothetical protein